MSDPNEGPAEREAGAVIHAIRGAIPTSRHATMLFDMVRGGLGDDAVLVTAADRTQLYLFRRDESGAVVPQPLLSMSTTGRRGRVLPLSWAPDESVEPPPRPGKAPALRNLGPAEITLHDGAQRFTVTYGDDGRWFETSRSASVAGFVPVVAALARGGASPVDLLASAVEALDIGRHGPGRVLYPTPLPGGVAVAWLKGLYAIRDALFDGRLPEGDGWVVADGYAGTALAWGATRDEALEAWRAEARSVRPEPVKPEPPTEPLEPEGVERLDVGPDGFGFLVRLRGSKADVEWPEPALENTPAVVIPLAAAPREPHPFGSWVRLLGRQGATVPTPRREDPGGFTLLGRGLAEVVDLDAIDAWVDAVVASRSAARRRRDSSSPRTTAAGRPTSW